MTAITSETTDRETIVCAAIRHDGAVHSVPRPGRHHHIIRNMAAAGLGPETMHDQGFVTSTGRYVDRKEACRIAMDAGQILEKTAPADRLFSEDLW